MYIFPILDIAIAVVDLIQELTDVDTLNESEEGASALIDALVDGQVIALLVQNLERLDETVKEEADGVHNTLGRTSYKQGLSQDLKTGCLKLAIVNFLHGQKLKGDHKILIFQP